MAAWRTLGSLVVVLAVTTGVRAQTYTLTERPLAGQHFDVHLAMDLIGEMRVQKESKLVPIKQQATAKHEYRERILETPDGGPAVKAGRLYKVAHVAITVGEGRSERSLRPERSLIVAHRVKDQLVTYSPTGPLTREELELIQHLDTLALTGLLPGKAVRVEEKWTVPNAVAQALCHFDGLTGQDLECRLEQVKDNVALVSVHGTATGIDTGAAVKTTVQADYEFDLQARCLISAKWKQTDERDQGPASPALTLSVTITMTRTATDPVPELHDYALIGVVPEGAVPPESMTTLSYADPKGRFELVYARDWQLVAHTDAFIVLRLLDRGDFVAQATVTVLHRAAAGEHLSDEEFKELVNATPAWEPDGEAKVEDVTGSSGNTIRRLAAQGQLDGLKATQYCYLIASPQGEQAVVAFTMTPAQVQALDTRDLTLVRGFTFIGSGKKGD
jgi:hypothetical protein